MTVAGAIAGTPPPAILLRMLKDMQLSRAFDREVGRLCKRGQIPGLIHLGLGEEAVAAGISAALRPTDKITSTHRAHGHFLAKGGDPKALMAELFGKQTGCCGGKGGSMHLVDLDIGFLGANGVVGAGMPLAVGSALGQRVLGGDWVTVCLFGDGANNQGTFHESLNLAAVWGLAVVFVCENNQYGISISTSQQQKIEHVAQRGSAYGIPAKIIDGNDAVAVFQAVTNAVAAARTGDGPTLIECKTYRIAGHYEGDSESYRPPEEVEEWLRKDPIQRLETRILELGIADSAVLSEIEAVAARNVEEAVEFAHRSPFPPPQAATADVFQALGDQRGVQVHP